MARRLKNAPKLTAYMNQLKKGRRERTFLKNAEVKENKLAYENRLRRKTQEAIDKMPRTPQQFEERRAQQRDMKMQKATMTEAQREEYGAPAEKPKQERPAMARSKGAVAHAYYMKTDPSYREEDAQARYEEYLNRNRTVKTAGQHALERGEGPRKGHLSAEDYRKIRKNIGYKKALKRNPER